MVFRIDYSEEKNQLLKATRGVGFDDVVLAVKNNKLITDKKHSNRKFKHQRLLVVEINHYIYAVPYVINKQKKEIFLKTVYPSRVLNKKYEVKEKNEKTKK